MRVLVNIRGCNGAGKSTIPMQMMKDPAMRVEVYEHKSGAKIKMMVFPTYGWVALGSYLSKTGGMDTISTKEQKFAALDFAWNCYPQYDILMEGVIDSTIRSTYIDLFQDLKRRIANKELTPRKIIVVNFLPPLETCIARVLKRNGGKPVKEDQIASKRRSVAKNVQLFRDAGITSLRVDTSKIYFKDMLPRFEALIHKYREVAD